MTATDLPDPLVPADVDLRGLEYMPLLGERLFNSDFELDADDAEFRVALRLWWKAWNQVPAGSLPSEERRLQKLAGLEEAAAKWKKVRARALHGFVQCSDGRLYHPVIAEQALIAWEKRVDDSEVRDNQKDRKRLEREDRKRMFAELRDRGVVPHWNTPTGDLRRLHAEHVTSPPRRPVTVVDDDDTVTPVTVTQVTVTDTAKTGRDGTGRDGTGPLPPDGGQGAELGAATSRALVRPPADDGLGAGHDGGHSDDAGAPLEGSGTRYGLAARAMRAKGCPATPGAPRLRNLVDTGASLEEFEAVAQEAVEKGKGPEWALQTLANRRAEAALPPKGGTGRVTGHVTGGHRNRQQAIEDSNRAVGEAWLAAQEAKDRETH